jgi:hypothetical protein
MKKAILTLAILLCSSAAFGESQYIEAKLGGGFPWAIQPGFEGDFTYGMRIDQMVSINFDAGYYFTSYNTLASATPTSGLQTQGFSSVMSANLIMILVNARIDAPFTIGEIMTPYIQCGVGYDIMVNGYVSTNTSQNSTKVFGGFALKLDLGTRIKLGDRSALIIDCGYNFCGVSRTSALNETLSVGQSIDVSGFSVTGGISFQI